MSESKEEELRTAAGAWAELCDISASSQLAALRADLIGYNVDSFGDIGLLVDRPKITTASGNVKSFFKFHCVFTIVLGCNYRCSDFYWFIFLLMCSLLKHLSNKPKQVYINLFFFL